MQVLTAAHLAIEPLAPPAPLSQVHAANRRDETMDETARRRALDGRRHPAWWSAVALERQIV
jgi:hypothetical protein